MTIRAKEYYAALALYNTVPDIRDLCKPNTSPPENYDTTKISGIL